MRRFRFVGEPKDYGKGFIKVGKIVHENYLRNGSDPLLDIVKNYPQDWQEVYENEGHVLSQIAEPTPKPLHKDTDLGHFAGLALQGILSNPSEVISNLTDSQKAQYALIMAEKLIKQLKEQGHA